MRVYSSFKPNRNKHYYKKRPFWKNKWLFVFGALILAVGIFVWWSIATAPEPQDVSISLTDDVTETNSFSARMTYTKGTVELLRDTDWATIHLNDQLLQGAHIRTGKDSRAAIVLPDDSIIRLNANAEIELRQFGMADIVINVIKGQVFHRVSEDSPAIYRVINKTVELTALGTAFNTTVKNNTLSLMVTESRVKVKVYDDTAFSTILNMRTIDEGYVALIDPAQDPTETIDSEEQDATDLLENEWYVWNKGQDEEAGFFLGIFEKNIPLTITSPEETEFETSEASITITGNTDPDAEVFIDGDEIKQTNGAFSHEYSLESGENVIEIIVLKGNNKNKKVLYITTESDRNKDLTASISVNDSNIVTISWIYLTGTDASNDETTRETPNFRVLMSEDNSEPIYGDTTYHIVTSGENKDTWDELEPGTYYFRVCVFEGQTCSSYSNPVSITLDNKEEQPVDQGASIDLTASQRFSDITLDWSVSNFEDFDAIEVVTNTAPDPTYPAHSAHQLPITARNDVWKGLQPGTYYFRVCGIKNDRCAVYSNNASFTLKKTIAPPASTGTISVTGTATQGTVVINWIPKDINAAKGFRVMYGSTTDLQFPGSEFLLATDPGARSVSLNTLEVGKTYFFRVCENLGSTCGVYSNEIRLTVE